MGLDWLKVCKDTIDKQEIGILAETMRVGQEEAFGWWFRLYCYADAHTANGFMPGMTLHRLSLLARVPLAVCLGLAADNVRGLIVTDDPPGVTFQDYQRHNGKSAKKRSLDAIRAQSYRDRQKTKQKPPRLLGSA